MPEPELEGLTNFLYEMGLLKRYKRTGWWIAGIDNPESIAEHSFRTAIIGYLLAVMEGADPARTAALCVFHDTQETRIGDVPSVGKAYVVTAPNPEVTADQVADFPAEVGQAVRELVDEYEAHETVEAQLAKDADKLECLIQAREYQAQGHEDVPPWIETSAAALRTQSAR
jgi:putative hydrolase of HD superfamily